ncbi:MAG TPA: hypothetical protein VLA42_07750 [Verrucomicrobiae bacterium]|nr:hypothetical protein [Verrucomicrobiae bacterium]
MDNDRMRARMEKSIKISLAGGLAQRKAALGSYQLSQWRYDYEQAVNAAMYCCGSARTSEAFLKYLNAATEDLLDQPLNQKLVRALAHELLRRRTLKGKEVKTFLISEFNTIRLNALAARAIPCE